ncbi:hypothetical protein TorRG33x02_079780, partial [Trema orientale]
KKKEETDSLSPSSKSGYFTVFNSLLLFIIILFIYYVHKKAKSNRERARARLIVTIIKIIRITSEAIDSHPNLSCLFFFELYFPFYYLGLFHFAKFVSLFLLPVTSSF